MHQWLDRQSDGGLSVVLFFAAGVWGLYWVPLRILEAGGLTDAWSVAVFNACPLILLLPYAFLARHRLYPHLRNILLIGGLTGCGLSLYATGLVASTVVRATILFYLTPVWSTIIGVLWLSERLGAGRVAAILLGIAGLACLVIGSDDSTPPLNVGDVLALLSGVFWGLGAAFLKRHPETPVGGSMACMILATAVISIGLGFLLFPDPFPPAAQLAGSLPVAVPAALIVLVPTAYLILWIARKLYPGRVGILMMSEVLVAILSASLFLPEETMSVVQWVGAAAIILSCLVEVLFERKSGPVLSS